MTSGRSSRAQRHRRAAVTVLIALAGFGAAPVPANAAVTLGSDLAADPNSTTQCMFGDPNATCTIAQTQLPGRQLTAPFDGVIVRWRLKQEQNADWGLVRLTVAQQVSGTVFSAIRSSPAVDPPPVSGPPTIHVFETQLPIAAGQFIGLTMVGCCAESFQYIDSSVEALVWRPALGDGEERAATFPTSDFEYLFNADLEPDCDGDGLGDESQDPSLFGGSCPTKSRSLSLDASKNKVRKGKRVSLFGRVLAEGDEPGCESSQSVELQRKRPNKTAFVPFAHVQTDPGGSFSSDQKVKKTFEYRAVLAEIPGCDPALSNIEKVKAKRKRK